MQVSSFAQLQSEVIALLQKAITLTMEELMSKLKNYIEADVYSYGAEWYEPSYELLDNWDYTVNKVSSNTVESVLSFSKTITYSGSPLYQHGWKDTTQTGLLDIVNNGKIGDWCNVPQLGARPFWDDFWKWAEANIESIFSAKCKQVGLSVSSGISYS